MENSDHPCPLVASLMTRVKHNVSRYYIDGDSPAEQEAHFRWIFLQSPGVHWPCDAADEPGIEDHYDRCFVVADALRQTLAEQYTFDPRSLYILIDPSGMRCEDTVYIVYLYTPDPLDLGGAVLLYTVAVPAGQRFATEDALATYLAEQYAQLARGYRRTAASVVATAN